MRGLAEELDVARRIARRAGQAALAHFGRPLPVETKADASPVTAADREAERLIAAGLEEAYPDDGLLGEEGASRVGRSGRRWLIDPIDGTREFVRGNPAWAVMLALETAGEVLAGVVHFPVLDETYFASAGGGAFCNQEHIRVSGVRAVEDAVLCLNGWNEVRRYPFAPRLLEWIEPFWAVRSMGGCRDAVMVARGQADLWLDTGGKPWDFAALKVIAEEAGGVFFDFAGRNTIEGGNCVIAAPGLEAEVRRLLALR